MTTGTVDIAGLSGYEPDDELTPRGSNSPMKKSDDAIRASAPIGAVDDRGV